MSVFLNEGILFQSLTDRNRANHCDYATTLVHGTSLEAHVPKWLRPRGFVVTITRRGDVGAKDRRYTPAGENTVGVSGAWSRRGKKAPRVPREISTCRDRARHSVESERFPLSDREKSTGVPANYGSVINRDYQSSRNCVRWKRRAFTVSAVEPKYRARLCAITSLVRSESR